MTRLLLILLFPFTITTLHAQTDTSSLVKNGKFPESYDPHKYFQKINGEVLAWSKTAGDSGEYMKCIVVMRRADFSGNMMYTIAEYHAQKPFTDWWTGFHTHIDGGSIVGYAVLHLNKFATKPWPKDVYQSLRKWHFSLFEPGEKTEELGINENLWKEALGFTPTWHDLQYRSY